VTDIALRFSGKDDGLVAQFRRVNKDIDQFEGNAKRAASSIGSVFSAVKGIAAAAGLALAIRESLQFADAIQNAADATGIGAEGIQRLQFLGAATGSSLDQLTGAVGRMQKQIYEAGEGSREASQAIGDLGLEAEDFFSLTPDERFTKVAQAISGIEDPAKKTALAIQLFGKSGQDLVPTLDAIGTSANEIEARFAAIGGPVSAEAIAKVDAIGDAFGETRLAANSLVTELLAMGSDVVIAGLDKVNLFAASLRHAIGGGTRNDLVEMSDQLLKLEAQMILFQNHLGEKNTTGSTKMLKLLREYNVLSGEYERRLRAGEFVPPRIQQEIVPVMSGGPTFDETEEEKREREKQDHEARIYRLGVGLSRERELQLEHAQLSTDIDEQRAADILRLTEKTEAARGGIITDAEQFLSDVRKTFGLKQIEFEEIKNQSIYQLATGMFGALARENSKLAKVQQGIAMAQTIWSTATGIMKAFETLPWPASLGAAAKVALTGALQIAKIKSTNYTGSGVSSSSPPSLSGGGGGTLAPPAAPSLPEPGAVNQGQMTVYISGVVTRDVLDQLMDGLRDGFSRDVVIIPSNSLQAQQLRNGT
jgi:hypothetical protein